MKIIKVEKKFFPQLKFIGKQYGDDNRDQFGSFTNQWSAWFENGWFNPLDELPNLFEQDGYVGLMRYNQGHFEYWIGAFKGSDCLVPEGYQSLSIKAANVGVAWIYGKESTGEIYGSIPDQAARQAMIHKGWSVDATCEGKTNWCFEYYVCDRFTKKDEAGNVILDYGIYLE